MLRRRRRRRRRRLRGYGVRAALVEFLGVLVELGAEAVLLTRGAQRAPRMLLLLLLLVLLQLLQLLQLLALQLLLQVRHRRVDLLVLLLLLQEQGHRRVVLLLLLLLLLLLERAVRAGDRVRPPEALWRARRVALALQLAHALGHARTGAPAQGKRARQYCS